MPVVSMQFSAAVYGGNQFASSIGTDIRDWFSGSVFGFGFSGSVFGFGFRVELGEWNPRQRGYFLSFGLLEPG